MSHSSFTIQFTTDFKKGVILMIKQKNILLVGGSGSFSRGLIRELLNREVKNIRIFARNNANLQAIRQEIGDSRIEPFVGDIRNRSSLLKACRGCDIIFHMAAMKHIADCEQMPFEAIETNVTGTENLISCAIEAHAEKVLYLSTDKAVNAQCTYGCTKLLGEKLILNADANTQGTRFMVFRSGNLLGSSGSVIPLFLKQIRQDGYVTLTDEHMSRFFITPENASLLLAQSVCAGRGGEIFLPVMPSVWIKNIARHLLRANGMQEGNIHITGLRPGEKICEQLIRECDSQKLCAVNENLVALPTGRHPFLQKAAFYNYRSDRNPLTFEQTGSFLDTAILPSVICPGRIQKGWETA